MALSTTNISTTLIANTIGVGSNDVGTLCTSSKINKWSRWKPIKYQKDSGITLSELESVDYGLKITDEDTYANRLQCINAIIANPSLCDWVYEKPTGTAASPYRLGDFRNYQNTPYPPIVLSAAPVELSANSTLLYAISFVLDETQQSEEYIGNLTVSDFGTITVNNLNIANMYLGLCFVRMVNSVPQYTFAISETTIANSSGAAKIYAAQASDILGLPDAALYEYKVYYFLSSVRTETEVDNYCIPLPITPTNLNYYRTTSSVDVICYNDEANNIFMVVHSESSATLSVTVNVSNNSGDIYNIGGFRARAHYTDNGVPTTAELLFEGSSYLKVPVGNSSYTVVFNDLYLNMMSGAYIEIFGEKGETGYGNTVLNTVSNIKYNA